MYYKAILKIGQTYEVYVTCARNDCAAHNNLSALGHVEAMEICDGDEINGYRAVGRYLPCPDNVRGEQYDINA